jgi:peptidoglycan/LPS O-acetylase OafA/YrhL
MSLLTVPRREGIDLRRDIPGLDGLRAIAIGFVLAAHLTGTTNFPIQVSWLPLGMFGVRIFFVISGYLITCILLNELRDNGSISLGRFYYRRALRLLPACYVFVLAIVVLWACDLIRVQRRDFVFAATYTMNLLKSRGWYLGHLWSLAAEEQFYLAWPLLLAASGLRRATRMLVAILLLGPLIRSVSPALGILGSPYSPLRVADALASGCLLARYASDLERNSRYRAVLLSKWFLLVPIGSCIANFLPAVGPVPALGESVMNVGIALTIHRVILSADSRVGRLLNARAVVAAGVLSYSLYLWQQPFLNRLSQAPPCQFPLNLILTFAAALASFTLVERPFLALRKRWEVVLFPSDPAEASAARQAP